MVSLDPARTALVAIDIYRGHLDPAVATLPPAERCDPVIARAAQLFAALRARRIPIVHVVTEYRDAQEIPTPIQGTILSWSLPPRFPIEHPLEPWRFT